MVKATGDEGLRGVGEVRFPAHEAITWELESTSLGAELVHRAESQLRFPRG